MTQLEKIIIELMTQAVASIKTNVNRILENSYTKVDHDMAAEWNMIVEAHKMREISHHMTAVYAYAELALIENSDLSSEAIETVKALEKQMIETTNLMNHLDE